MNIKLPSPFLIYRLNWLDVVSPGVAAGATYQTIVDIPPHQPAGNFRGLRVGQRRLIFGVFLTLGGAVCFAGTTFCSQEAFRSRNDFNSPFLVVYLTISSTILFLPAYTIAAFLIRRGKTSLRQIIR